MMERYVRNIGNALTDTARARPHARALVHGDQVWSWSQIEAYANSLAAGLLSLGVQHGERVAIRSGNSRQMFESMYGIVRTGAVYVPISAHASTAETIQMLNICDARVLIAEGLSVTELAEIRANCPTVTTIVTLDAGVAADFVYDALLADHMGAPTVDLPTRADDICWQNFTSGTTGVPKSGMNSHGGLNYMLLNVIATMMPGADHRDATLAVAPLGHGTGTITTACTMCGAATILTSSARMDVEECWRLIDAHRVSILFSVPTILMRLLRHPSCTPQVTQHLRHVRCGAAPMSRTDLDIAVAHLGAAFIRSYGAVEHVGAGTIYRPANEMHAAPLNGDDPLDSIGLPRPGTEIGFLDDDGQPVAPGEAGEMCLRGPGVFFGYYNNPEANAAAFHQGWYRTGDIGRMGANGFIYLVGRKKEMFKSGGLQISPNEVQNELAKHPAVLEANLVSLPDSDFGEVGVAAVLLHPGQTVAEGELIAWIRERLAHYKAPRRIFILDLLPRSANGKVPKPLLRDFLYERGLIERGRDVAKFGALK